MRTASHEMTMQHQIDGESVPDQHRFHWVRFYMALADKLLTFRDRRDELIAGIHAIGEKVDCMSILNDQYQKNVLGGPLKDICPFTTIGIFNRGLTDANRKTIARALAGMLGVLEPVPESFDGPKGRCSASDYLAVLDTLKARFQAATYPACTLISCVVPCCLAR